MAGGKKKSMGKVRRQERAKKSAAERNGESRRMALLSGEKREAIALEKGKLQRGPTVAARSGERECSR